MTEARELYAKSLRAQTNTKKCIRYITMIDEMYKQNIKESKNMPRVVVDVPKSEFCLGIDKPDFSVPGVT